MYLNVSCGEESDLVLLHSYQCPCECGLYLSICYAIVAVDVLDVTLACRYGLLAWSCTVLSLILDLNRSIRLFLDHGAQSSSCA